MSEVPLCTRYYQRKLETAPHDCVNLRKYAQWLYSVGRPDEAEAVFKVVRSTFDGRHVALCFVTLEP